MGFAVIKSAPVMVRPSPGKTTRIAHVQLSSWDRSYVGFQVTALLLFDGPVEQAAEAIKKGLSRALVHYSAIAGRLAAGDDDNDELHVACTDEGVPFLAATASCAMADVHGLLDGAPFSESLLDDLAVYYHPTVRRTDPLLLMQVTEFPCGGFAVGVTWNHTLADGQGIAQFLQAIGKLTSASGDVSLLPVEPVRDNGMVSLPLLSPPVVAAKQWLMLNRGGMGLAYVDIAVPAKLIDRVKSEYKAAHSRDGGYCTTFEAAVAVLWRCRTHAIGISDPSTPAPLAFFVNVRKHVGIVAGYYGNCAVAQVANATAGEVAGNDDMNNVVDLIKRAKNGVPELLRAIARGSGVNGVETMDESEMAAAFGYNTFMVSSWRNIGFEGIDLGSGAPARVLGRWQQTTIPCCLALVSCMATAAYGERMLTQCVREEHVAAFLDEINNLAAMN